MADDVRINMATRNLESAVFAAREAVSMEKSNPDALIAEYLGAIQVANNEMGRAVGRGDPHWPANRLRTYVCSAVLLSAGAIEAAANEFFVDAAEGSIWISELGDSLLRLFGTLWREWLMPKQVGTLEKMQVALTAAGHSGFDKSRAPYQDADNLFYLRNSLVHFTPEWRSKQERHKRIEDRLRSYGFTPNPFAVSGDPFFPKCVLGADCACWAVRTAHTFALAFYQHLGLKQMTAVWQRLGHYLQNFENWKPIARRNSSR